MTRFRDYDGRARLALLGNAVGVLSFGLAWVSVHLGFQVQPFTGFGLVVLPATLDHLGATGQDVVGLLTAALAAAALLSSLAALLLALIPGLRDEPPNKSAGFGLSFAGLLLVLVVLLLASAAIGPRLGQVFFELGGLLAVVGLLLAVATWRRGWESEAWTGPSASSQRAQKGPGRLTDEPR